MAHDLVEVIDGKARLHLHPGQTKAWDSTRRFVFVIAGTQGGKTSFGPWWLNREIERCGEGDYLAVTASYDLFKLKLLPEMRRVFEDMLGWHYFASDRLLAKGNSRIILRSASAEGGLESATAKAALLDECGQDDFRLESWEAVQRRLSLSQGRVLGTTTPYNLGWLKTEVFDRWRAGDPDFEVVQFKNIDNPRFPVAEYHRMKTKLPGWKFKMFYDGEFSRPAGMIYSDFEDPGGDEVGGHIVAPFPLPVEWPRYVGLDFGATNTAMVWLAEDTQRAAFYLYREYLDGGKTTPEHAAIAKEHAKHERVWRWAGGSKSETQQRMDWSAAEVSVDEPLVTDVESGIDRVIQLIKEKRLFVFSDCKGIRDEFGTYSRELDESGQVTEKIKDKEKFHRLDALRYIGQTLVGDPLAAGETVDAIQPTISSSPY